MARQLFHADFRICYSADVCSGVDYWVSIVSTYILGTVGIGPPGRFHLAFNLFTGRSHSQFIGAEFRGAGQYRAFDLRELDPYRVMVGCIRARMGARVKK